MDAAGRQMPGDARPHALTLELSAGDLNSRYPLWSYPCAKAAPAVLRRLTEADLRLWTTLVRFDPVYVTHFKCDKHRISDYLNLYGFLRDIYQMPGIAETVNFDHIRHHYFRSHKTINPTGIISIGPWQDLSEPHGRDERFA